MSIYFLLDFEAWYLYKSENRTEKFPSTYQYFNAYPSVAGKLRTLLNKKVHSEVLVETGLNFQNKYKIDKIIF